MQADELRKAAAAMEELGREIGKPYGMSRGLIRTAQMMRKAADTIESLRDRLQEIQGVGGKSRYSELFGTPEKAAWVVVALNSCRVVSCEECAARGACGYDGCGDDYDVLLEWLRGDA